MEQTYTYKNLKIEVSDECKYSECCEVVMTEFDNTNHEISKKTIYVKCDLWNIEKVIGTIKNSYCILKNNNNYTCQIEVKKEGN